MSRVSTRWQGDSLVSVTTNNHQEQGGQTIDLTDDVMYDFEEEIGANNELDAIHEGDPLAFDLDDPIELSGGHEELDGYPWKYDGYLKAGVTVKLTDGSYLRIVRTFQSPDGIYFSGILMKRNSQVDVTYWKDNGNNMHPHYGKLRDRKDELCAIVQHSASSNPPVGASLVKRPLTDVLGVRQVIFTNRMNPPEPLAGSCRTLYCRWKYTVGKKKTAHGWEGRSWQILHLSPDDCDPGHGLTSNQLDNQSKDQGDSWHQGQVSGQDQNVIDLTGEDEVGSLRATSTLSFQSLLRGTNLPACSAERYITQTRGDGQPVRTRPPTTRPIAGRYNFADALCGGGGMMLGAHQAGLHVSYAIDKDLEACLTAELNIPSCQLLNLDLRKWIMKLEGPVHVSDTTVDVLHVSFACQAFSTANSGCNPGRDQGNIALSYSLEELVKRVRPRIVTLEQVDGILAHHERSKAGHHLFAQFNALTSLGYQLRCDVLKMSDYGVAQTRRRLIIIAAAPGQKLPPWPKPTHGYGPGMARPVTVQDILAQVPRNEAGPMGQYTETPNRLVHNRNAGNRLTGTITCSSQVPHPTENRNLTLRELSMLQGFPADYQFVGNATQIRRQIGNAVPPPFAEALFRTIIETLDGRQ